ncbi:MAG: SymE family type I addiction module toxin [Chitinophagaceae bacterium]|nr:SymE family type I addiction module toxin [Chitinophagaceae bacterium]
MEAQQPLPKVRKLTVCNKGSRRCTGSGYITLPVISITGKWLEEMGFRGGHTVDVTCEKHKLTITISPKQRFEL